MITGGITLGLIFALAAPVAPAGHDRNVVWQTGHWLSITTSGDGYFLRLDNPPQHVAWICRRPNVRRCRSLIGSRVEVIGHVENGVQFVVDHIRRRRGRR